MRLGKVGWVSGLAVLAALFGISQGCAGILSTAMHALHGNFTQPEFDKLSGKRVAVLAVSDSSHWSEDQSSALLARNVSERLDIELVKTTVIGEEEIDRWRDENGWENEDMATLGRAVKADYVILFELSNMRLKEGPNLFRGQVDVVTTVYDVETGEKVFRKVLQEYRYPDLTSVYASEINEKQFQYEFLRDLATTLSWYFHPYDAHLKVAKDDPILDT
jgi:hypothetical protein